MGLWNRFKEWLGRRSVADEDAKLKLARNALAGAFDNEAEQLNSGRMIGFGSTKTDVSQATQEAQDLGSHVRKLEPRDPHIEEALLFHEAGLLAPLDDRAREVLAKPWPDGFDADAKLDAVMKALHESRERRESR
jgi:hypothetical protein